MVCKYFFSFCRSPFHSVHYFFCFIKLLAWCSPHLLAFALIHCTFGVISKKSRPVSISKRRFPRFSYICLTISGLKVKSSIHLELIFVSGIRWGLIALFCKWTFSFPPHHFYCRNYLFPILYILVPLSNISLSDICELISELSTRFLGPYVHLHARNILFWLL